MEAYLEELGLLHCIQRALEEEDVFLAVEAEGEVEQARKKVRRNAWKEEDAKCKSIMIHKIADSQLERIRGKQCPKAIWETLKTAFDQTGVSGVFFLLQQLAGTKYDERQPMEEHILAFEKVVRELESANIMFDEPMLVFFLLQSMPKSYS